MRRSLILCTAVGFVAAVSFAASPAQASFRVIKWNVTNICQIYDFGVGGPPVPSNYRVLTGPLPSYGAALRAKDPSVASGEVPDPAGTSPWSEYHDHQGRLRWRPLKKGRTT